MLSCHNSMVTRRACPICAERRELNDEDVLPQWVRRGWKALVEQAFPGLVWQVPSFKFRICTVCNSQMGELFEEQAAPILKPMMAGHVVLLTPRQQGLVGAWITRTNLALSLRRQTMAASLSGTPPNEIHEATRAALHAMILTGIPPLRTSVRIGLLDFRGAKDEVTPAEKRFQPSPPFPKAILWGSSGFAYLIFDYIVGEPDGVAVLEDRITDEDWLIRVWPPQVEEILWPPPNIFLRGDRDALAQAWGKAAARHRPEHIHFRHPIPRPPNPET